MQKTRNKIILFAALAALFIVHWFAMAGHWYVKFRGIDIPMHFLGGATIALSVLYIWRVMTQSSARGKLVMAASLVAVLGWECFEAYFHIAGAPVGTGWYWVDTVKDIIFGLVGAYVASKYVK